MRPEPISIRERVIKCSDGQRQVFLSYTTPRGDGGHIASYAIDQDGNPSKHMQAARNAYAELNRVLATTDTADFSNAQHAAQLLKLETKYVH